MKIDEGCINHNALKLIKDVSGFVEETILTHTDNKTNADTLVYVSGYARGVLEMAEALKEVLKC